MSTDLYDIGARLRAASEGRVVPRVGCRPCADPTGARWVAIDVTPGRRLATVAAVTSGAPQARRSAAGRGLEALVPLGLSLDGDPVTLIVSSVAALDALTRMAQAAADRGPVGDLAALIGLWSEAVDHAGTSLVVPLVETCTARWYTGEPAHTERHIDTWLRWLHVTSSGPHGLLELAHHVLTGPDIPTQAAMLAADDAMRTRAAARRANNRDWRRRDNAVSAAIGLRSRCDAAELHASALLNDPHGCARGVHAGYVITGTVTAVSGTTVTMRSERIDARIRPAANVTGRAGSPRRPTGEPLRGKVESLQVLPDGTLDVVLSAVRTSDDRTLNPLTVGDTVTWREQPVDPRQQDRGRRNLMERMRNSPSWLTSRDAPPPVIRRQVPLEVMVAAAD